MRKGRWEREGKGGKRKRKGEKGEGRKRGRYEKEGEGMKRKGKVEKGT